MADHVQVERGGVAVLIGMLALIVRMAVFAVGSAFFWLFPDNRGIE